MYLLFLAAFSANVPITVPSVNKLSMKSLYLGQNWPKEVNGYLVLIYFPSLVLSLSDVAFSEPARSIRLCTWALIRLQWNRMIAQRTRTEVCTLLPPRA